MEAMRQSWSDDRLDALNEKVDLRFEQVDRRFEQVDRRFDEVDRRFDEVDEKFDKVDKRFDKVESEIKDLGREMNLRFDSIQRTMWQTGFILTAAVLGVLATQL